jgi:hypothetical protein
MKLERKSKIVKPLSKSDGELWVIYKPHLVAAASDLLYAAKMAIVGIENNVQDLRALKLLKDAIAKAEGRLKS